MDVFKVEQPNGWDEWLAKSRFGDILQSWEWGEVKKLDGWQAIRLRVEDGEEVVGQAQILVRSMPLSMTLYYLPRGPVLDYTGPKAEAVLEAILQWLTHEARAQKALMVKLGPAVDGEVASQTEAIFARFGLRKNHRSVQVANTIIVDMNKDEEAIFTHFSTSTRRNVRLAMRDGVRVQTAEDFGVKEALEAFYQLYQQAGERGHFPPRPLEQFQSTWDLMAGKQMCFVQVASGEDGPLAANFVLRLGDRAYQLWAGSDRSGNKKYATYLLQWETMRRLKALGMIWYDMWGISPTDDPKHPWAGVSAFKKGFGGQPISFVGDYDLPLSPMYPVFSTADKMRTRVLGRG